MSEDEPVSFTSQQNAMTWVAAAQAIGFNEIAKQVSTLGEKIFARLARDEAYARFLELGGQPFIASEESPLVLTLTISNLQVRLHERDIDLMRAAVEEHDARKKA